MRYRFNCGWNLKTAEVGTTKDVSSIRGSREKGYFDWNRSVESNTSSFDC